YWLDIGRPDDYDRANAEFSSIRPVLMPFESTGATPGLAELPIPAARTAPDATVDEPAAAGAESDGRAA
ncbi:hypothetical protein ACIP4P_12190, partial [Kitasatospora sp. NPDC089509]